MKNTFLIINFLILLILSFSLHDPTIIVLNFDSSLAPDYVYNGANYTYNKVVQTNGSTDLDAFNNISGGSLNINYGNTNLDNYYYSIPLTNLGKTNINPSKGSISFWMKWKYILTNQTGSAFTFFAFRTESAIKNTNHIDFNYNISTGRTYFNYAANAVYKAVQDLNMNKPEYKLQNLSTNEWHYFLFTWDFSTTIHQSFFDGYHDPIYDKKGGYYTNLTTTNIFNKPNDFRLGDNFSYGATYRANVLIDGLKITEDVPTTNIFTNNLPTRKPSIYQPGTLIMITGN